MLRPSGATEAAFLSLNIHTRPLGTHWVNEIEGTGQLLSIHETQEGARIAGRIFARSRMVDHVIHDQDGCIQERTICGFFAPPPIG
jgi:hypothetical protein